MNKRHKWGLGLISIFVGMFIISIATGEIFGIIASLAFIIIFVVELFFRNK
jgi:uncharacterized protein (DUF58 family)